MSPIRSSIAAVLDADNVVRGTAFFVGDDAAITCLHVIAGAKPPVSLRRNGTAEPEAVLATDLDEANDLALVRIRPRPQSPRLIVSEHPPAPATELISHGFPVGYPVSQYPEGYPLLVKVRGDAPVVWGDAPVALMVLERAEFQPGYSGAPAVDPDTLQVVGVLTKYGAADQHGYAIPAKMLRERWPALASDVTVPTPPFDTLAKVSDAVAPKAWSAFDPRKLHCLVVGCEADPQRELYAVLKEVLVSEHGEPIWKAFRAAAHGRRLLGGDVRELGHAYAARSVERADVDVVDAFSSPESLVSMTRLLVEADLVLFDVTGFEPGVMLLAGIRAATRRGVTISSHGGTWQEGHPLERPFNLSDLSLSSHAPPAGFAAGKDPRLERLAERVGLGFVRLSDQPHYLDFPVYDALRRLGSQETTSIPLTEEVLVLCSYHSGYYGSWTDLRRELKDALGRKDIRTTVARLQDGATPQLVSQTLYERIRRCAGCVADWTFTSPSTFFELGVRLVASPWGAVQLAERAWLERPTTPDGREVGATHQLEFMQRRFEPLVYDGTPDTALATDIGERLIHNRETVQGRGGHPVRRSAVEALSRIDEELSGPDVSMQEEADLLNHPGERENVPQTLFYENPRIKENQERASLERRVAAWLYLEHRVNAGVLPVDDSQRLRWQQLGSDVAAELFDTGNDRDLDLALEIQEKLS